MHRNVFIPLVYNIGTTRYYMGFPGGSVVKNPPANAGDMGSIRLVATHSSILAWEIPWTEEPGGLQSMGSRKSWSRLSN